MIVRERSKPIRLMKLEALYHRLPDSHPRKPIIHSELKIRINGYKGEKSIDYHLSFLSQEKYLILHDLRLQNDLGYFFQIDTIAISPNFIIIIEVKSFQGTIRFDANYGQLVQTFVNESRALEDPIAQMERHIIQLENWLHKNKFKMAPLKPLIVISNPATLIETTSNPSYFKHITHRIKLPMKVFQLEEKYTEKIYSQRELRDLASALIKAHTPEEVDILKDFKISHNEIIQGVRCPECMALPMERLYGKWKCLSCHMTSKDAHLESLKDYTLLMGPTITNKKICEFLHLPSRNVATYILQSLHVPHIGHTKGRKYLLTSK
ncbi:MAG TPA: nuclease-related domain-containing protein [Bacillaceae bacterium]